MTVAELAQAPPAHDNADGKHVRDVHPRYEDLGAAVARYLSRQDCEEVARAYEFATRAHDGHLRRSGHPYIEHPLAAALSCADLQLDVPSLQAALLHDVMEDCGITRDEIIDEFGVDVAKLVDGVTKLDALQLTDLEASVRNEQAQAENLRKMFVAMAEDVRVVIVKLADRLHNMRTLGAMPAAKQVEIARETMEIYAPLAARLGIWQMRAQLEDLAFKHLEPEAYREIVDLVASRRGQRDRYLKHIRRTLEHALEEASLNAEVRGRVKHLYSIHQKIKKYGSQGKSFSDIYDLLALRVLTQNQADCYAALGVVHGLWRPIPGEFNDYIATPRPSGYRSLHTTAFWSATHAVEVQIRTQEMDAEAEYGVAVHWMYKEGRSPAMQDRERLSWLRQLVEWQGDVPGATDFLETLRSDIFQDQVFVHTPAGEIVALRSGATPLDFAFRIHTDVGYSCVGAKVNGRLVQLSTPLNNGDVIEILTSRNGRGPSRDWLNPALEYVTTQHARTKIRQWFRKQERSEQIARGREELERELRRLSLKLANVVNEITAATGAKTLDDALALIGGGDPSAHSVALKVASGDEPEPAAPEPVETASPSPPSPDVHVLGSPNILTRLAGCCTPKSSDPITGFITRGKGVTVHRSDCHNVVHVGETARLIDVEWGRVNGTRVARLSIDCWDRVGLARDIAGICADEGANMVGLSTGQPQNGRVNISFTVEARNLRVLQRVIHKIDDVRGVFNVEREA